MTPRLYREGYSPRAQFPMPARSGRAPNVSNGADAAVLPGSVVEKRERSDVEKPYDSFGRNGAK
jgi:hypothetical protein